MPLKIWSLLAGTSIALQSISVLFSTLLLPFPRCCLRVPTDPRHSGQEPGTTVGSTEVGALLRDGGNGQEISRGHQGMEAQTPRSQQTEHPGSGNPGPTCLDAPR